MSARVYLDAFAAMIVCVLVGGSSVSAVSLEISPLQYTIPLTSSEIKKGFVDITNPSALAETVSFSVQAFRQTDNNGSLEFYDDEMMRAGITLDYDEVEIGPKETLHLAFSVEAAKLPAGESFAAILGSTKPDDAVPAAQSVRVGSLLFITNGNASEHSAVIEQLSVPFLQVGSTVSAHFAVQNTGLSGAFFPDIDVTVAPYDKSTVKGPLVFAGKTRQVDYTKKADYFGIVRYTVQTGGSQKVAYSFVITGYWRGIIIVGVVIFVAAMAAFAYAKRRTRTPH